MRWSGVNRKVVALTSAHVGSDVCQGAVPALAAYFAVTSGYSIAQVAGLILAVNAGSSLVQPILGSFTDRLQWQWCAPAGVILAGIALSTVGVSTASYAGVVSALLLCGVGIAVFHPEAGRLTHLAVTPRWQPRAMSVFALGGNAGFALGPLVATPVALAFGPPGIVALGGLPVLLALPLAWQTLRDRGAPTGAPATEPAREDDSTHGPPSAAQPREFARLGVVITLRSTSYYALQALLPALFITILGQDLATANSALSLMLVAGTAATLIGGWRAGKHIQMRLISWPLLVVAGCLVAIAFTGNVVVGFILAAGLGAATFAGFSPSIVLAQRYLPNRAGLAAGVAFGLAPGLGSLFALLASGIADRYGASIAVGSLVVLPLIALPIALTLRTPAADRTATGVEPSSDEPTARR